MLAIINTIARHVPEAIVGAGTVLTPEQLQHVKDAGAQFAVSPGITARLRTAAWELEVALLPGVATASEVQLALECGYERLKFFSAEAAGGPAVLQALYGLFPQVRFCPTGGIHTQSAPAYLKLPNVTCVGGSWLAPKKLMEEGDWLAIAALAHTSRALACVTPITGYALPELLRLPSIVANTISINWLRVLSIILISCSI